MKANTILQTIGNTPHVRIKRLFGHATQQVWIKSERANPGGSIKDRIALSMVEDAERAGALKPGGTIVEPTSGNTGIGLAMVAAVKGYKLVLVMPDSMSRRAPPADAGLRRQLRPHAAREGHEGLDRARRGDRRRHARRLDAAAVRQPGQHRGARAHHGARKSSADFPDGIDVLITGVGTGGHITGCAQVLKKKWPKLQGLRGRAGGLAGDLRRPAAPHPIQGIGAGFIPKNLDTALLDGVIQVDAEPAREMARRCAREEGMLVGISSGATLAAIAQKLPELPPDARVLGFNYDTGERYLSVDGFLPA